MTLSQFPSSSVSSSNIMMQIYNKHNEESLFLFNEMSLTQHKQTLMFVDLKARIFQGTLVVSFTNSSVQVLSEKVHDKRTKHKLSCTIKQEQIIFHLL